MTEEEIQLQLSTSVCFDKTNKPTDWFEFLKNERDDYHDRFDGLWYRNFSGKECGLRYPEDKAKDFGHKIRAEFVKWRPEDRMSVNCVECTPTIGCSPLLQSSHPAKPQIHTAIIDLTLLRDAYSKMCEDEDMDRALPYARYEPVGASEQKDGEIHPGNPCHYDFCIDVVEKTDLIRFRRCLQNSCGNRIPDRYPREPQDQSDLRAALDSHSKLISFVFDVVAVEALAGRY